MRVSLSAVMQKSKLSETLVGLPTATAAGCGNSSLGRIINQRSSNFARGFPLPPDNIYSLDTVLDPTIGAAIIIQLDLTAM